MLTLKQCGITLREEDHTYWDENGRQYYGITDVIRRHIFPDKYSDVPADILNQRAEFGTIFHSDMATYITSGGTVDLSFMGGPLKVFMENYSGKIKFIASEYVVTDGERFASPIDAVDEDGILYDFKTSTHKDIQYWRWQLSVYKYLFKLQNGYEPAGLRVLWINKDGEHDLVDIDPIPEEEVVALLEAEKAGRQYVPTAANIAGKDNRFRAIAMIEQEIVRRETELKKIKADADEMKAAVLEAFLANGIKKWDTDFMSVTVKDGYTRQTVDSKALKDKFPEAYDSCLKESAVKPSLIIKLKPMSNQQA